MNSKKVWLMVGEAGTGKSHLLGDVVTKRKEQGEPTILILGEQFTSTSDPLTQIKEILDKVNFLIAQGFQHILPAVEHGKFQLYVIDI